MHISKTEAGVPCVTLDGRLFEISKWGAEEQTETLFELMGILGDAVGGLADLQKNTRDPDANLSQDVVGGLIGKLTGGLSRDRQASKKLLMKLSSGERILCDGVAIRSFDKFYENNLFLAFQVARASVEVQYGSFFAAAGFSLPTPQAAQMGAPAQAT